MATPCTQLEPNSSTTPRCNHINTSTQLGIVKDVRRLAKDGDLLWITSECIDVLLYPIQRASLVKKA